MAVSALLTCHGIICTYIIIQMNQKLDAVSNVNYILYKYIPSVGISETIDSKNVRYQYEYDNFCRLAKKKLLLGSKGYTLEDYDIHFKQ